VPRPKWAMRRIKEVLRLKEGLGLSDTAVSRSVRIARSTVKEHLDRAAAAGLNWETVAELSEEELDRRLFAAVDTRHWDRPLPDWEAVEKELRGRGVTLRLLWLEYLSRHPEGYRYTQFCAHFHAWQRHSRPPTMRRQHRAGEALEVDYAGMTLSVIDKGVVPQAQVFVACLPCSDLTHAALAEKIEEWNNRPFAPPREGSRRSLFEAIERDKLNPLPAAPFVVGQWLVARVNIDYHVAVDGHFYSVPYRLVHRRLDVFLTATAVAIFHQGERVASHPRSAAKAHHTTTSEHMPPAHQAMAKRTPDKLRTEAAALGLAIGTYVDRLLDAREHPEQAVRACLGVLRLAGTYGKERLELACERALAAGVASSRYVERLLKADRRHPFLDAHAENGLGEHGNLRGPAYYN